jgi:hypothetical protein
MIQFLDHNSPRRASHAPDSPDLAASDFWFVADLKREFQGSSFDEPDELLSAIQKMLKEVDRETLDAAFQEWMIRLQKCIDGNDDYVE